MGDRVKGLHDCSRVSFTCSDMTASPVPKVTWSMRLILFEPILDMTEVEDVRPS